MAGRETAAVLNRTCPEPIQSDRTAFKRILGVEFIKKNNNNLKQSVIVVAYIYIT